MGKPKSIILCNLQNSGSSAIDPIFREYLAKYDYYTDWHISPADDSQLLERLDAGSPIYAWLHIPNDPATLKKYQEIILRNDVVFILLHRDPRDAAISMAHDFSKQHSRAIDKRLVVNMLNVFVPLVKNLVKLLSCSQMSICEVKFSEIKTDILSVLKLIFLKAEIDVDLDVLEKLIHQYSFESQTNLQRGTSDTVVVRSAYMLRKGIDGDWKQYFDEELETLYAQNLQDEHLKLGYSL